MIRILAIPAVGTAAAVLVILLTHAPRADDEQEPNVPRDTLPRPPEPFIPQPDIVPPVEPQPVQPEPPRPAQEYQLQLDAKGGFTNLVTQQSFADAEALAEGIGEPRHTLVISNADGVPEAALDAAMEKLRERYTVRKVYRAPKEQGK